MGYEFFVPYLILVCAFAYAARNGFSPESWSIIWTSILGSGALMKILIEVAPSAAPYLGLGILAFFAVLSLRSSGKLQWSKFEAAGFAVIAIFLLRGLLPQFDLDSLNYHLPALKWLYERPELPLAQRTFVGQDFQRFWIGTEDFSSIPGLLGNLALYAGIMGSVFKCLTFATLVSLVPRSALFVVMTGLFLIFDDHFLFSGQNATVFLNPSFVGVAALAIYFSLRAIRGHSRSGWIAFALLLQVCAIKFHGLYLLVWVGVPLLILLGVRLMKAGQLKWPQDREWFLLAGGLIAIFSFYGLNLLNTGTPFYPFDFGPFKTAAGSMAGKLGNLHQGDFLQIVAKRGYHIMTYPGNLALKAVAVVFIPTCLFAFWRRPFGFRIKRRNLITGLLYFSVCIGWAVLMTRLDSREARFDGRYPRLIFGVAIIGLAELILSLRILIPSFFKSFTGFNRTFRMTLPVLVFVFCASIIDRYATNVPLEVRPSWRNIAEYLTGPKVSPDDLFQEGLVPHLSPYVLSGREFLQHCEKFIDDPKLGGHLAVAVETFFPSYLGVTHADRPFVSADGHYEIPAGDRQWVLPRASVSVSDPGKIVCESSGYVLFNRL